MKEKQRRRQGYTRRHAYALQIMFQRVNSRTVLFFPEASGEHLLHRIQRFDRIRSHT